MRDWIDLCETIEHWKRWWGNVNTGELYSVPNGQEHDSFMDENLELFFSRFEMEDFEHDFYEDLDSWLIAAYEKGWQAIIWDGSNAHLSLRFYQVVPPYKIKVMANKVAREVPVEKLFIDIEDGAHVELSGNDLKRFMKSGVLPNA